MKNVLKKILLTKFIANTFIKSLLRLHSFTYDLAGLYSSILNNGVHPKHKIMKHKEWFLDNIKKEWVVLDVGCNTGMMPELMSGKASFVYGIEIDNSMIEKAKKERNSYNIEFICADATIYDYSKHKSIDCVTLSNVLEHIEYRVEFLKKLIQNVKWNNKKNFLIRVPMIDREWIAVYKKNLGLDYRLDKTHFIEYTFEEFQNELENANICINSYHIKFGEIYAICESK